MVIVEYISTPRNSVLSRACTSWGLVVPQSHGVLNSKELKQREKGDKKRDTKRQIKTGTDGQRAREQRDTHSRALSLSSLSVAHRMSAVRNVSRDANAPAKPCTMLSRTAQTLVRCRVR